VVVVDREARAGKILRAREPDAAPARQLAELVRPVRCAHDPANAFGEADRADVQVVGRERLWLFDDAEAVLGGIELELLGDFIELNLLAEPALRRTVAALGAAWRFVGEDAASLKVIGGGIGRA